MATDVKYSWLSLRVSALVALAAWSASLTAAEDVRRLPDEGQTTVEPFQLNVTFEAAVAYVVLVEQFNADVVLSVTAPSGEELIRIDSPGERLGVERLLIRPARSGIYRLRAKAASKQGSWGHLRWSVQEAKATEFDEPALQALANETEASRLYARRAQDAREQAAHLYEQAVRIWKTSGRRASAVDAQLKLGWLKYTWFEEWDDAAALGDAALKSADAAGEQATAASARLLGALARLEMAQTTNAHEQTAAFARVLDELRDAIDRFQGIELPFARAYALNNIGLARHFMGDSDRAVSIFEEAAEQFSKLGETSKVAMARQNVGWVRMEQGDYTTARVHLGHALEHIQSADDASQRLFILNNLALVNSVLGEYDAGFATYIEAVELARKLGERSEEARALHGLGAAYARAGNSNRAIRYFEQALPLRTPGRGRIATLLQLGNHLRDHGDLPRALALHDEARRLASLSRDLARTHLALGLDRSAQRDYVGALSEFDVAIQRAGKEHNEVAALAHIERGRALAHVKRIPDAINAVSAGIELNARSGSVVNEAYGYAERARLHRLRGAFVAARKDIDAALGLSEKARAQFSNPDMRATYLGARSAILEEKLLQLSDSRTQHASASVAIETLLAMERWRAAGLKDALGASAARKDATSSAELRRLQDALVAASFQLDQVREIRRPNTQHIEALLGRITAIETELDSLDAQMTKAAVSDVPRFSVERLQDLQSSLGEATVIAYYTGKQRSWRWRVDKAGVVVDAVASRGVLRELISDARRCWTTLRPLDSDECAASIAQLSNALLPHYGWEGQDGHVVFVPDGLLSVVAFSALQVPNGAGGYVLDRRAVTIAPALAMRASSDPHPNRRRAMLGIVSDPAYGVGETKMPLLERLVGSRAEGEALAAVWPPAQTIVLSASQATRQAVLDQLIGRAHMLHFATHVSINELNPDLSRIELAMNSAVGPRDFRGRSLDADLVVLSGCDTGLGRDIGSEGALGLQHSLLAAGTRNVVATLWRVSDRSAQALMSEFYQKVSTNDSYGDAVREAQLVIRRSKDYSQPYHWAAFQLYAICVSC